MVRVLSKHFMIGWLFLFIMTFCLISLSEPVYSADKAVAKLTSFSGTVLIKSRGDWGVKPETGLPLYSDDKVVTKMGIATITFDDGAVIEIKANSNLLIRESEESGISKQVGAAKRQLRLILGKILFRSGKGTSVNTSLETTTMVCGLRGTAGTLSIDASGQTYLQFTEGGGDTIGNFISGIATDVAPELANLNAVQRAGFVAAAAADQAKRAAEKLAGGGISNAEAALASANAAEAAANEAYTAAEAMLTNPDENIRNEARAAMATAQEAIDAAKDAQQRAIDAGATGSMLGKVSTDLIETTGFDVQKGDFLKGKDDDAVLGNSYGVLGDSLTRLVFSPTPQGNESQILPVSDATAPTFQVTSAPSGFNSSTDPAFVFYATEFATYYYSLDGGALTAIGSVPEEGASTLTLSGLADGSHTIDLIARDAYGNSSEPQTYTWIKDTMAPVVTLAMTPDGTGATTLVASTSNTELGTVSYQFINLANQSVLSPTGLNTGVYQIGVIATDQAGNISTTQTFTFALQNAPIAGNTSGTGSIITGSATGASSVVLGQSWGGMRTSLSGSWSGTHTGSLALASGGYSQIGGDWISLTSGVINPTTGAASGTSEFIMLGPTSLTRGTGTFTGTFNSNGTWTGTETASGLVNTALVMSGNLIGGSFFNYNSETADTFNSGYAGLVPNGNNYDYVLLGSYANESGQGPYLSFSTIYGQSDVPPYMEPSALLGTIWSGGTINGILAATYDVGDTNARAGIFYQEITADYYEISGLSSSGMWLSEGTVVPIELATGIDGVNKYLADSLEFTYPMLLENLGEGPITVDTNYVTAGNGGNGASFNTVINNQDGSLNMVFGVWAAGLIGYYQGTPGNDWAVSLNDKGTGTNILSLVEIGSGSGDSTWASNEISAFVAGAWVNLDQVTTGVAGGKLIGTFDPDQSAWQAVAAGSTIDTRTFLAMAADPAGRVKLAQLDIPCIQVGITDLTGSGFAMPTVSMNDVKFFAYSTGAAPKIWATGDVSGTVYIGAGSPAGTSAMLSGNGFGEVYFGMNDYNTQTGRWDAHVSGSGTVSSYGVNIEGNAAGGDASSTSFSGTASGVTRPAY